MPFHHDPAHTDEDVERITAAATARVQPSYVVTPGVEGAAIVLGPSDTRAVRVGAPRTRRLSARGRAATGRLSAR